MRDLDFDAECFAAARLQIDRARDALARWDARAAADRSEVALAMLAACGGASSPEASNAHAVLAEAALVLGASTK